MLKKSFMEKIIAETKLSIEHAQADKDLQTKEYLKGELNAYF